MVIESAKRDDIPVLARIHHEVLLDDFLPSLGLTFLVQVYYPSALHSTNAATFVARLENQLLGFVTIAHDSDRFTRDILRSQWPNVIRYALVAALHNPPHVLRSLQVLWASVLAKPNFVRGEIVFIAVDQAHQRKGIGQRLVIAATDYLAEKSVPLCRTKTLATNTGVIRMYKNMGWYVRDRFRLIGREYVTLVSRKLLNND